MRTKIALFAAVALGLVAAIAVRSYVRRVEKVTIGKTRRVGIAVAAQSLAKDISLKGMHIKEQQVEVSSITDDHIFYDARYDYVGDTLKRKVTTGKPILKSYFVSKAIQARGTKDIGDKMRAVTCGTDQISGVAGLITPGCRVDILGTFRVPGRGPESAATMVTKSVARNVPVIAIDHRTDLAIPTRAGRRAGTLDVGYSSVTLHVNPLHAAILVYAQQTGKLTFTLRNISDQDIGAPVPHVTMPTFDDLVDAAELKQKADAAKAGARPTMP